jgi:hypothetical protein
MDVPDLRGRRIKYGIMRYGMGWRVRKATPILYVVGVRPDGTVGRMRNPYPGEVSCVIVHPDDPSITHRCTFTYPDHFAVERVHLKQRTLVNLDRLK